MTAEAYLLFVAPVLLVGVGLTIFAIEELSARRRRRQAYVPVRVQRRRDLNR